MMSMIDTLRFSDNLKQSGFTEEQAKGMAKTLSHELLEQLVTKEDLHVEVMQLMSDMNKLHGKIVAWVVGIVLAGIAINATLVANYIAFVGDVMGLLK